MFIAREKELALINEILGKPSGSAMIYGKRKVGKTTLIIEALKSSKDETIYYECIKSSIEDNVEGFVDVLVREKVLAFPLQFKTFIDVFAYLNTLPQTFNITIDEYPYLKMFSNPETVDSMFQKIIDNSLSNIRLFLSGSHIGRMKDLLKEKNALYGRFSLTIHLKELNYKEAASFYPEKQVYDKVGLYSVFGGSPYINRFIDPDKTLKENIISTILKDTHPVYQYAEHLLITDFTNAVNAERIFYAISNGKKKYGEIESKLKMKNNGLLSKQLAALTGMEIISKTYPVNKPDDNKKTSYEINDNLLRFYYAFIYKNKSALQVLGAEAFYNEYIEEPIKQFISFRFEEICRSYFSLNAMSGKLKGITNIGTFYYDDSVTRTSGDFEEGMFLRKKFNILRFLFTFLFIGFGVFGVCPPFFIFYKGSRRHINVCLFYGEKYIVFAFNAHNCRFAFEAGYGLAEGYCAQKGVGQKVGIIVFVFEAVFVILFHFYRSL